MFDNDTANQNDFAGDVYIINDAVLQLTVVTGNPQIPAKSTVRFESTSATLSLNQTSQFIAALNSETPGKGIVRSFFTGNSFLTLDGGSGDFSGSILDDPNTTLSLVKTGGGTQVLSGFVTIDGTIAVNGGKLVLNGPVTSGTVTASGTGSLRGTGTIAHAVQVQNGGAVAPGTDAAIGILSAGSVAFAAGTFFDVRVRGIAFNDFDVLNVNGTVNLGNAQLRIGDTVDIAAPIVILDKNTAGPITWTFAGLPEGSIVTGLHGHRYLISYVGGTGNDVTLGPVIPIDDGPTIALGGDTTQGKVLQFEPTGPGKTFQNVGELKPFGVLPGVAIRTFAGDVNNDGVQDTVAVTGPGTPIRLTVVSGMDNITVLVAPFDPFGGDFKGGGFVTGGDFDGDGRDEFIVTPDQGGGPRVSIFELQPGGKTDQKANFFGIDDDTFRGGARAAVGDVNKDGIPDIAVGAGFLGGPRTAIFNGTTVFGTPTRLVGDFLVFPGTDATTLRNGVFLTIGDIDGDGFGDLIAGGGPGGAPRVFILSGQLITAGDVAAAQASPIANFFVAGNVNDRGGIRLSTADADGDKRADLVTGSGEGSLARVRIYRGKDFVTTGEPGTVEELNVFGGGALPGGVFVG